MEFVNCSSDLDVISIEWLYNRGVIYQVTGDVLQLIFNPVNDTIHNRQYTCRVTSPYGIQEKTIRIVATGSNDGCSVVFHHYHITIPCAQLSLTTYTRNSNNPVSSRSTLNTV